MKAEALLLFLVSVEVGFGAYIGWRLGNYVWDALAGFIRGFGQGYTYSRRPAPPPPTE